VSETVQEIELFKAEIHFPQIKPISNIQEIFNKVSDLTFIKSLSSYELMEYNLQLNYYALYLLTQENRLKSYINWCESNIKYLVGKNLDQVTGYGFSEKETKIRSVEENAVALDIEILKSKAKLDTIYFMSQKIQSLSDCLKNLSFEKSKMYRTDI
jgi:hypothetical protein